MCWDYNSLSLLAAGLIVSIGEDGLKVGDCGDASSCIAMLKLALEMPPLISDSTLSMDWFVSQFVFNCVLVFWVEFALPGSGGSAAGESVPVLLGCPFRSWATALGFGPCFCLLRTDLLSWS